MYLLLNQLTGRMKNKTDSVILVKNSLTHMSENIDISVKFIENKTFLWQITDKAFLCFTIKWEDKKM
ncbi:hypothetical protein EBO34_00545 [Alteribacter keqinensis]|uniref:Uncharacterized protein n=1 Tax=Alteribacter keqinensis TaxID=2483800 RepID=A0A3M7TS67_9BACI|nr:hypothetical protein EBO34_00545 [Alteribacter keqinensis]